MLKRFIICASLAFFVVACLPAFVCAMGTDLPKAPSWRFGSELPEMDKGLSEFILPKEGFNEAVENQKIINSWGYKARPIEEIKDLLPKVFYDMVSDPENWGEFRVNETEYIKPGGPYWEKYVAATEKYKGDCTLDENGWLNGYKAGLPFPDVDPENDPQGGTKIVWNFLKRFVHDDRLGPYTSNLIDRRGNMRVLFSDNINFRYAGRLTLDPKPLYEPNPKNIDFVYGLPFMRPYGMRGTVALLHRHQNFTPDNLWMYLPAMRRVRRMATTQTQDKLPGGMDVIWDTVDGFMGFVPNFEITYLGRKELLIPVVSGSVPQMDVNGLSGVDNFYQRRNCYVVEAKYKQPITTDSFVFWIDPEMYYSCYMVNKDMRGNNWVWNAYYWGRNPSGQIKQSVMCFTDVQRRHITRVSLARYVLDVGYTAHDFSMEQLIKKYGTR